MHSLKDVSIFLLLVGLIYGGFASWINAMVPNPPTNEPFEPPFGTMPFFWPLWGLVGDIELDLVEENIQVILPPLLPRAPHSTARSLKPSPLFAHLERARA